MTRSKHSPSQTKNNIMDTFWNLYEKKRIEKITVSEICQLANINRSTFYSYFKDVYDVLDTIEARFLPTKENYLRYKNTPQNRQLEFKNFLEKFEKNKKYVSYLLSEHGDPNFALKIKKAMSPILKSSLPASVQNQKTIDLTVEYILCSSIGVITYWFNNKQDISSEELFYFLHDMFASGIPKSLGFHQEVENTTRTS